jgi:hypothetical protein
MGIQSPTNLLLAKLNAFTQVHGHKASAATEIDQLACREQDIAQFSRQLCKIIWLRYFAHAALLKLFP